MIGQNRCGDRTRTRTAVAVVVLGAVRVSSYWPIWLIGCVALLVAGVDFAPFTARAEELADSFRALTA